MYGEPKLVALGSTSHKKSPFLPTVFLVGLAEHRMVIFCDFLSPGPPRQVTFVSSITSEGLKHCRRATLIGIGSTRCRKVALWSALYDFSQLCRI